MTYTTDSRSITTTDEMVAAEQITKRDTKSAVIGLRNTGAKGAKYKVEASVDGTNWYLLGEEKTLANGAAAFVSVTDYWPFLRVSAKSSESGKPTTVKVDFAGISA